MALLWLRGAARATTLLPRLPTLSPCSLPSLLSFSPCTTPSLPLTSLLHTSSPLRELSEFFEDSPHRGETAVRVGREWRHDELRLKSNQDLHKLWFVLLKERNMLLTMEHAYKEEYTAMPNPERKDKVELSMEALEEVVRERNRAYYNLEVGESGERERRFRKDWTGRPVPYKPLEHVLPERMNTGYRRKMRFRFANSGGEDVKDFQQRYREKMSAIDRHRQNVQMRQAARVVRRFPQVSMVALKEQFPLVDTDRLMRWKKIRGHNTAQHDVLI